MPNVRVSSISVPATFPTFGQTTVTTAGTRVRITVTSIPLTEGWVYIVPFPTNTGLIYVGDVTVAANNGVPVGAGMILPWRVDNLNEIYLDASVSGEKVGYQAF